MPGQKTRVDNGPVRVEHDVEDLGSNGNLRHGRIEEELAIIRASIREFLFEVVCVALHRVNKGELELSCSLSRIAFDDAWYLWSP
jgi:hypothetical protein